MKKRNLGIVLNILSLIAALVINYLATNLPFNNLSTKEISDSFDIYFVPAGYAFSIWGLIYIGLLAFAVFQALPKQKNNERLAKVDGWFVVSNLSNALWLVSFHFQHFILALVFMVLLLVSLIIIFTGLEIGKRKTDNSWKWLVETPFSIYLGWVTIATIANVTQVLYFLNWDGFGISSEIWFVIVTIIAVLISALMSFTRRAFEYTLVIIWAFVGIAVKFPDVPVVNYAAWGGAIAVAILGMVALAVPQPNHKP
jgi:benzodiazapine receptor